MIVRAEKLRAFNADGPITKSCAFGGAGNNTDVVGHDLILNRGALPNFTHAEIGTGPRARP